MSPRKDEEQWIEAGTVDELTRIVALQLRYSGAPQAALVHDLSKLRLPPARIAELLGTTPNNVSQRKREKRPVWPPPQGDR